MSIWFDTPTTHYFPPYLQVMVFSDEHGQHLKHEKQGGRVLLPSCNVRYELYPSYRSTDASLPNQLVPQTYYLKQDSRFYKIHFICSMIAQVNTVQSMTKTSNYFSLICFPMPQKTTKFIELNVKVKERVCGFFLY
jgi:hypothetical protein